MLHQPFPREADLFTAIQQRDIGAVHLTYTQAYTPLTKTHSCQQPFLLTLLLGKAFISRQADLQGVQLGGTSICI